MAAVRLTPELNAPSSAFDKSKLTHGRDASTGWQR
jgi:hypothetical protein